MALNKEKLKSQIKSVLTELKQRESDPERAADEFAEALSGAIEEYIKGMEITYISGLITSAGPVTGVFQNQLS